MLLSQCDDEDEIKESLDLLILLLLRHQYVVRGAAAVDARAHLEVSKRGSEWTRVRDQGGTQKKPNRALLIYIGIRSTTFPAYSLSHTPVAKPW